MQPEFWLECWREQRTRFHRHEVMPLLIRHWPALSLPPASRVLVPLAGKTLDMIWLAAQGYRVLGVELSPLAVQQFFSEHHLHPQITHTPQGQHHTVNNIELICGDIFDLHADTLATCNAVYDRAALIALPPDLRARYVSQVYARLPTGCQTLLITLEYPQTERAGPPFSIGAAQVDALFADHWDIQQREHRNILDQEPGFQADGVTALHTGVYQLRKRG